jgi:uncharacterized protein YraI
MRRRAVLGTTGTLATGLSAVSTGSADRSFDSGQRVRATVHLSVRTGPNTGRSRTTVVDPDATGHITAASPVETTDWTWYQIEWDSGVTGWSVAAYLAPTEEPAFAAGDRLLSTVSLSVRAGPTTDEPRVDVVEPGTIGTVTDRDPVSGSQYRWLHVEWATGTAGWSAASFLQAAPTADSQFTAGETVSTPSSVVEGARTPSLSASTVEFWPETTGTVLGDEPVAVAGEPWVRVDTGVGVPAWFPESALSA